jgi:hypothetical protein
MEDDGTADESDNEDYADMSDAAGSKRPGRPTFGNGPGGRKT